MSSIITAKEETSPHLVWHLVHKIIHPKSMYIDALPLKDAPYVKHRFLNMCTQTAGKPQILCLAMEQFWPHIQSPPTHLLVSSIYYSELSLREPSPLL